MTDFRISRDLVLPPDAPTQAIAILARKGAGKTYTAKVIAEEFIAQAVPTVIVDPTGAWWGLRSSASGERAGLPVHILGGDHGDVPLEPTAGRLVAEVVLDHPGAFVLDLSAFESKADEVRFGAAFFDALYRKKRPETGPLALFVDEADIFAPQNPREKGDQLKCLGALESIVRRGRIKGLGDVLITQRAAVLNKNVLTQTECLFILQTTGPQDRKAIGEWINDNADPEEGKAILQSLVSLERGEAWVWSPSWLRRRVRVKIRTAKTFDSSRTPEAGETLQVKAYAKVDVAALGAEILATQERAKENDPAVLKARIRALETEVRGAMATGPKTIERIVEKPVSYLDPSLREEIEGQVRFLRQQLTHLDGEVQKIDSAMSRANMKNPPPIEVLQDRVAIAKEPPAPRPAPVIPAAGGGQSRPDLVRTPAPEGSPSKPELAVLNVLNQFETRTQQQVSILAGYSPTSGSFFGALASLRRRGYIEGDTKALRLTPEGKAAAPPVDPLPADLLGYWSGRLAKPEAAILKELAYHHPVPVHQDVLASNAGYSATSGSFFGALAKLRKLDLISGGKDALSISPDLVGG